MSSDLQDSKKNTPDNAANFDVEKIKVQLKKWQEKLLDTSKGNPLLGLNRTRTAKLKIVDLNYLDLFQKIVLDENQVRLPFVKKVKKQRKSDLLDADNPPEEEAYKVETGDVEIEFTSPIDLKRKLRKIYDNSRTTVEERGVVTLYLTFGTIHWHDDYLEDSVSPILLVPCELTYKGPDVGLRLNMADEDISINPVVKYYFKEKHKIELPEFNDEDLNLESFKSFLKKVAESVKDQGWKTDNEVWLGTFSFESIVLYNDLKLLAKLACANPLIAAFAHASGSHDASETLGDDLDSLETPKIVPAPILPADSSQLKALTYVGSGQHLVIHGPPGTGKSQTISNIIADALGNNKKVLFVSAKMAALNVVFDRLKKEGLGQFCLEAHGTKAGKLKIIEELKRTLESEDFNNVGPLEKELQILKDTREKLNGYVLALHEVIAPMDISVFQAIGRFSKLHKVPDTKAPIPWDNVLEVSEKDLNHALDALSNISKIAELFNGRKDHPWRGFSHIDAGIKTQERIEADLKLLIKIFTDIDNLLIRLKKLLPKQSFSMESVIALAPVFDAVSKIKRLPKNWWTLSVAEIKEKENLFKEASLLSKEFNEKYASFRNICELPHGEIVGLLQEADVSFKTWPTRMKISYFQWKGKLKKKFKEQTKLRYSDIQNYWALVKRLLEIEEWFGKNKPALSVEVLTEPVTNAQAFEDVAVQCGVALLIKNKFSDYDWTNSKITELDPDIANASAALASTIADMSQSVSSAIERIDGMWAFGFVDEMKISQTPMKKFVSRAQEILANLDKFREWVTLQRAIESCEKIGLSGFLEFKNIDASLLPSIFEKRFFTLWIDEAINKKPILSEFSSLKQQELIEKLRMLDQRIRHLSNVYIKAKATLTSKQVKSAQAGLGNGTEIGILRFEMQKRKRIKPLRKLFSEIPHVLQALKPCMLMSPISVSTYLKPETFHFDLVIFDEASQLPTPEAIPSILRANQVVVAGDPKQLPPTSFFSASLTDSDSDDSDEDQFSVALESLLDDCVASVPVFQETNLRWHYRSRDERLINFSNSYFYDKKLVTFPSVRTDNDGIGVKLEYIPNGIWDRGKSRTNRQEARKTAQLVVEHFIKFPERSLGVVALNASQREAIEDALNDELQEKPELLPLRDSSRQEAFFIKSLENVQGDERDVIIISVGYGKSADGNLTLNFGPLNSEGGWRRLNVLVTRAKWQIILVTSLRSSELHRISPQNFGAMSLKNFIEYAERNGSLPPDPVKLTEVETNDFEDSVREVLVERGYAVDAQVGVSSFRIDLAIRDPKDSLKYLIGIECDGATYHSSRVARDRDLLRQEILQDMGWKLHRVWSTEWFHNRDFAIKLMIDSIEQAKKRDSLKYAATPIKDRGDYDFKPIPAPKLERRFKEGIPYVKYDEEFDREILMGKSHVYRLRDIIADIIETEGPIHQDLLYARLKEVFGVQKIGDNIKSNVEMAIRFGINNKSLEQKGTFIWKKGADLESFRLPGDDVKRSLDFISPQEISLAILYLAENQFGIMQQQIPQSVSKVFEITRTDTEEIDRIREITDELIDEKKLALNGNQVNIIV
jgi:very-short-patch-repair endonuclease